MILLDVRKVQQRHFIRFLEGHFSFLIKWKTNNFYSWNLITHNSGNEDTVNKVEKVLGYPGTVIKIHLFTILRLL